MSTKVALEQFKQGVEFLRNHLPGNALPFIRRAVELERDNPYYLSFLGLALAQAQHRWAEAEVLCETALRLKRNEPRLYLNLAEVYLVANRKEDARETLAMGLQYATKNPTLLRALERLQDRRTRVLPFLTRRNFLNRHLGRLRHKVLNFCHQHWRPD